jgi:transposase
VGQVLTRAQQFGGQDQGQPIHRAWQALLARTLGEAAVIAGRTDTFLGERYRRIAKRRGKQRAIVAVGRSILVIIWHLLADDDARFIDLGPDHFTKHVNPDRLKRNHIRRPEALGYTVTVTPAA